MLQAAETTTEALDPTPTADGFYYDIPHEEYLRWNAASASRLKALRQSPAHMRAEILSPKEPTPEMKLGTKLHQAILEPHIFFERHVVMPDFASGLCDEKGNLYKNPRATNKYRDLVADWQRENPGLEVIDAEDYTLIMNIAISVKKHRAVNAILAETPQESREVSYIWTDAKTGVRCKARADVLSESLDLLADFKSTTDASPKAFPRTIINFGYHHQADFYLHGAAALGKPIESFVFIPFEKTEPFAVAAYRIRDEALEIAHRENEIALAFYAECQERNEWPSYSPEIEDISVPEWMLRQAGF